MNHKEYKELLYLSFTGEITGAGQEILNNHLQHCAECRQEMAQLRKLDEYLAPKRSEQVPENLIDEARSELRKRLAAERVHDKKIYRYFEALLRFFELNYKYIINGAAYAAAGILAGFLLFSEPPADKSLTREFSSASVQPEEISRIRNIRLTDINPDDDEIEFSFEAVKEVRMKGSIHDEQMRGMLMYAVMNGNNPGVRLNSLNAINAVSQNYYDDDIKGAIISAAKYDNNPGVRREALMVLKNFPFDQEIKQSYIYVIFNDTSSGMRIEAINELIGAAKKGTALNNEEREMFRDRLLTDNNNYIRLRAKAVLEEYN